MTRRGLSLIEVMLSLAICAMLLGAVATAFSASGAAIDTNEQFFRAAQAARVSMNHLLTEIRRCQALQVPASDRMDMFTFDDRDRTYRFVSADNQLKLITNDNTADRDFVLAGNVTSATFTADVEPDPKTHVNRVVRVSITLVITIGRNQVCLTGSAAPRRYVTYQ